MQTYFNLFFVLFIQHGAAHVYPKLASLPVTHPLRKEAADVKVIFFLCTHQCLCKWFGLLFGLCLSNKRTH